MEGPNETAATAVPRGGGEARRKLVDLQRKECPAGGRASTSNELRALARAVRRIHDPMRATPEAVYAAKDAIAARLVRIANALELGGAA
ncbi:MAG: hypothetical protein ACR652_09780 [Methylocystis sp.]|uniref:hypothetical protein n=1 Tax=Methylocystis sp. TaxID=1911079 RepID=UPI003DA656C3